ncbi:MAG: hypothetical protein WBI13_09880 [Synechococcus sp.]|uniref:hypothetical protein n=1 Tax=Synechococcus sp. MVIR-18-1 TaxID=1386941 RepID=UPI001646795B|nr:MULTISPECIES: hypothetical protein [unclassified Synechococcus]MDB4336857.1 hypothetical protein [Synechococcus sp. AH-603-M21]MDB4338276.1 hypothetical protein [Synechococcus sp. AH-603-L18]MDB4379599.1 hypothetical protein [bacterium]QNI76919.1 hypothetical protein SynMVIR181_01950 [Synechococcus sp. MVIR-18-1]
MISPIRSGITLLGLIALMALISLNPRTANRDAPLRSLKDNRIMPRNSMRRLREQRIRD